MPFRFFRPAAVARTITAGFATALLTVTVWAAVPAAPAAAASGPVTSTTTSALDFSTSGQGMWGPGSPSALGSGDFNLFTPIEWSSSSSSSSIATVSIDKNFDVDATNVLDTENPKDANSSGSNPDQSCTTWNNDFNPLKGSEYKENDSDPGKDGQTCIDSNLDIDYANLDTDSDGGNQNDLISTYWGGAVSASTSGTIGLSMALKNVSAGSVSVNYPVSVTQTVTAPGSYVKAGDQVTFASAWSAQSGASLTTDAAKGAAGLDGTFGFSASAGGKICVDVCTNNVSVLSISAPAPTTPSTIVSPVTATTPLVAPGVSGTISGPSFGVSSSSLSGNTLTATGKDSFWNTKFSLDSVVQDVTGITLASSVSVLGDKFSYNLISGSANPIYAAHQTLTFSPTLMETLSFSTPVGYTTYNAKGVQELQGTSATVSFPAGGKAVVTVPSMPSGALSYTTSYALAGSDFTNQSAVEGSATTNFSALSLSASFLHNPNKLSLGPVYQSKATTAYTLPVLGTGTPFGKTGTQWALGGFTSKNGASGSLNVDTAPPMTTYAVSGKAGNGDWYTGPATVTLTARDSGGSGVAATYYSIDNGANQSYDGPFTISRDGTHTVGFYSVDNAGNQEVAHKLTVKIDQTAPLTTPSLTGPEHGGWFRSAQLTLSAEDNARGSGVATTSYSVNDGSARTYTGTLTFSTDGQYAVSFWSTDLAGNKEKARSINFQVDGTPPRTTDAVSGKAGNAPWYTGPATVTLTASDNAHGSGVAATYYTVDGGATLTYGGAFTITTNGTHAVSFYSTDNAGNQETAHKITVKIDQTAPASTESLSGTLGTNGWYKAGLPVVLTLTATDNANGSGVASTSYSVNGAAAKLYKGPVTFPDGVYTVAYASTDVAGNVEKPKAVKFKVDQTPPTVTYTGNTGTYTVDQTVDITCTATDNLSGVASSTCSNLDVAAYTLALGSHTLTATATDKAGNTATGSATFTVSVTYTSLCSLTQQFESKAGVASSLCSKLDAAAPMAGAGDAKTAANILAAYKSELAAQSGKSISAADVRILDGYVTDLESQIP